MDSPSSDQPRISFPLVVENILKQEFEAVAQGPHIRVHRVLELERVRDHFDRPGFEFGVLSGFEAEVEEAGVFGADAEGVYAPFRVGFRVGRQPPFWKEDVSTRGGYCNQKWARVD